MAKTKVLVTEPIHQSGLDLLKKQEFELVFKYDMSHEQLIAAIGQVEAVLVRSMTNVNREVIASSP